MSGFDDSFWTLEQALAWIAFHDRDLVDVTSAAKLPKSRPIWLNTITLFNQTALGKYMAVSNPKSEEGRKFRQALEELTTALQRGDLVASSRPKGATHRTDLGRYHWIDHHIAFNQTDGVWCSAMPGKMAAYNDEIRFDSVLIKKLWPAPSDHVAGKLSARKRAYDEFYAEMKASPHKRTRVKEPWVEELVGKIPGLTVTAAKEEWSQAVKDAGATTWTRGGRPRKTPGENPPQKS
ncbi:hypothetical protein [Methylobacterium sp. CM6257]